MGATIGTRIHTLLHGKLIGRDEFGNRYYQARRARCSEGHKRRWVIYNGVVDASKVPPAWHGWLHYTHEVPLAEAKKYAWQKEHKPNLTGTQGRYLPPGHISKTGVRAKATADYEPWSPNA